MRRTHPKSIGRRRGNILIVTLLLLALFATVGLTIVYYTKDLSEQQRINIEAQSNGALTFSDDGSMAFNQFLSNLIYDSPGPTTASLPPNPPSSAIWGHSLMRTMYGGGVGGLGGTTVAWNGVGTFHEQYAGMDRGMIVNLVPFNGAVRPEYTATVQPGTYVPKNAPYTYPDVNNFFLASWVPATGEVLLPSFYRPFTWRNPSQPAGTTGLEPPWAGNGNSYWTQTGAAYASMICRPRPWDNGGASSTFPYPPPNADGTYTGDVQNIAGSYYYNATTGQYVAHNDAIWVDIGMPPMTLLTGKTVKPLVAATIVDLDSVLNYNVHGNVFSISSANSFGITSPSGVGLGPWEINLVRGLTLNAAGQIPAGWDGSTTASSLISGRPQGTVSGIQSRSYNKYINSQNLTAPLQQLPLYGAVPWNTGSGAAPGYLNLSGLGGNSVYSTSPFPTGMIANLTGYSPTAAPKAYTGYDYTNTAVTDPAMLYNPSEWSSNYPTSTPAAYPVSDLQSLISQYSSTPYYYASTTATNYLPGLLSLNGISSNSIRGQQGNANSTLPAGNYPFLFPPSPSSPSQPSTYRLDPANNLRGILTPYSWALDLPGLAPNFFNLTATNALLLNPNDPTGLTIGTLTGPAATAFPSPTTTPSSLSDFASGQWNNGRAGLGPIDLNRPLADYRPNTASPLSPTNMVGSPYNTAPYNLPAYSLPPYMGTIGTQTVPQAVIDRQQFAMSIFVRLAVASGADANYQVLGGGVGESISFPNGMPPANSPAFNALRALAQLAANIVDYIDSDDVSTMFVWNPPVPTDPLNPNNLGSVAAINNSVVFGVEKPRVVINEAFAEVTNNPNDPALANTVPPNKNAQRAGQTNGNPYVRFWFELVNPTNAAYNNTTSPLGPSPQQSNIPQTTGAVTVRYTTGVTGNAPGIAASYSPYLVQIVRSNPGVGGGGGGGGVNVSNNLRNAVVSAGNVTGAIVGAAPDLTFDFSAGDATPALYTVSPANGAANGTSNPPSYLVCAPAATMTQQQQQQKPFSGQPPDWNPINANGQWTSTFPTTANVITAQAPGAGATTSLTWTSPNLSLAQAIGGNGRLRAGLNHNLILLRRLANPYLPPNDPANTNPAFPYKPNQPVNAYITVDYMDYLPATDQILMLNGQTNKRTIGTESNTQYPGGGNGQGGQPSGLSSLGRVQPYTGWTSAQVGQTSPTTGTYGFTFPTSLVVPQNVLNATGTSTPMTAQSGSQPYGQPPINHTFGYVNSAMPTTPPGGQTYIPSAGAGSASLINGKFPETIMTPFDWFPHMDRQLVNQSELLQVSMGKPHEYTLRSIVPGINGQPSLTGNDVVKFGYMATGTINSTTSPNTLYRALDVLRIQPYGHMTALGGRVPGRLNINTIQDKRVWDSLLDAQNWNGFRQNPPASDDVTTLWKAMIGTRTPSALVPSNQRYTVSGTPLMDTGGQGTPQSYVTPVPGQSVYDTPTPSATADRPFLPFGAPTYKAGGFAYSGGSGLLLDTLTRGSAAAPAGAILEPVAGSTVTYQYPNGQTSPPHPYQQVEALRKIMNSTTTVSHTFAVWSTIGYFDYNMNTQGGTPVLGAEYYSNVPGDLRRKYFAVVDRSMVGLEPSSLSGTPTVSQYIPFFTTVNSTATTVNGSTVTSFVTPAGSTTIPVTTSGQGNGNINSNGTPTNVATASSGYLAIGTGATREVVQVSQTINPNIQTVTGATVVTISALKYPHYAGESVSNVVPGNPGPAANWPNTVTPFYYSTAPYTNVVPFVVRLQ